MVSFSCEGCGDVLTKKKLDPHTRQCRGASFTCLDCMVHFYGTEYRAHTSCMSEAQKYQGALYRPEKEKKAKGKNNNGNQNTNPNNKSVIPNKTYSEDTAQLRANVNAVAHDIPPAAPSPPSAAPQYEPTEPANVFDFLVESEPPNAASAKLAHANETPSRIYDDDQTRGMIMQYGAVGHDIQTPAARGKERRDKQTKEDGKTDKKRKRLHVDTSPDPTDTDMVDVPSSTLHTGLTGGLNRLLKHSEYPASPDYSGDDMVDSPASPLKRSKREKVNPRTGNPTTKSKSRDANGGSSKSISDTLLSFIGGTNSHVKSTKDREESRSKKSKHASTSTNQLDNPQQSSKSASMVPYGEQGSLSTNDTNDTGSIREKGQLFLAGIVKGEISEKGDSVNKMLKRYHRQRNSHEKVSEEKELWKSLRLRRNDRGEVVVFVAE